MAALPGTLEALARDEVRGPVSEASELTSSSSDIGEVAIYCPKCAEREFGQQETGRPD